MTDCLHENFAVQADFQRMADNGKDKPMTGLILEVSARCTDCNEEVKFRNPAGVGLSWAEPKVQFGHGLINLPCYFADEPMLGLGLPGYEAGVWEADA